MPYFRNIILTILFLTSTISAGHPDIQNENKFQKSGLSSDLSQNSQNQVSFRLDFTEDGQFDKVLLTWASLTNVSENSNSYYIEYQINFIIQNAEGKEIHNDRFILMHSDIEEIGRLMSITDMNPSVYFNEFFSLGFFGAYLSGVTYITLNTDDLNEDYLEGLIDSYQTEQSTNTGMQISLEDVISELLEKPKLVLYYRRIWNADPGFVTYCQVLNKAVWVFPD